MKTNRKWLAAIVLAVAGVAAYSAVGLFGGAGAVAPPTSVQIAFADDASPADAALAEIYDRACRACHSVDGSGAPLTGHMADWQARETLRGGMQALLRSTRQGYRDMPAMGLCNDCSDDEFLGLIAFMKTGGA
ncbi:c-type cytochrome [Pukyongiella litopenaei]|uniref:C-type cytochrome n=1 Tax=Pukyongiella litopenaei TaxID=2605946 RepID=A0A2S0MR19_9RHOB|nr:c-type cytochrome [Pukyongiella litopenaei]AVO38287.1 c-type cytochrome [Pukyongiella litopenaei]